MTKNKNYRVLKFTPKQEQFIGNYVSNYGLKSTTQYAPPINHGGIQNAYNTCYNKFMENEYPFTQSEYARIIGVTKECLRTRRRTGKLIGEYKVIENQYFYKRPRPNQQSTTLVKPPVRRRKRGQHYQSLLGSAVTHYPHFKMKQHNELKMIAKLQRSVSREELELIPAAIHHIKQQRQMELERFRQEQHQRNTLYKPGTFRNYGQGIYNCKKQPYRWVDWDTFRSNGKAKKKYQYYD